MRGLEVPFNIQLSTFNPADAAQLSTFNFQLISYRRAVSVQFTILGSGSGGNCAYLETPEVRLLIDAGFSGRQIRQRLASISRTPETLTGILLTHEHGDHAGALDVWCKQFATPIYCNGGRRVDGIRIFHALDYTEKKQPILALLDAP